MAKKITSTAKAIQSPMTMPMPQRIPLNIVSPSVLLLHIQLYIRQSLGKLVQMLTRQYWIRRHYMKAGYFPYRSYY